MKTLSSFLAHESEVSILSINELSQVRGGEDPPKDPKDPWKDFKLFKNFIFSLFGWA